MSEKFRLRLLPVNVHLRFLMANKNGVFYELAGTKKMQTLFKKLADGIGPGGIGTQHARFKKVLMIAATQVAAQASSLAPRGPTGRLKASISAMEGAANMAGVIVKVDGDVFYAPFVEFGTSRANAHPFFRPAFNAARADFPANIADELGRLIEAVANENVEDVPKPA